RRDSRTSPRQPGPSLYCLPRFARMPFSSPRSSYRPRPYPTPSPSPVKPAMPATGPLHNPSRYLRIIVGTINCRSPPCGRSAQCKQRQSVYYLPPFERMALSYKGLLYRHRQALITLPSSVNPAAPPPVPLHNPRRYLRIIVGTINCRSPPCGRSAQCKQRQSVYYLPPFERMALSYKGLLYRHRQDLITLPSPVKPAMPATGPLHNPSRYLRIIVGTINCRSPPC